MTSTYKQSFIDIFIQFTVPKGKSLLVVRAENRKKAFSKHKIYDYIVLSGVLGDEMDIQSLLNTAAKHLSDNGRLIIVFDNYLYKFVQGLWQSLFTKRSVNKNWISVTDLNAILKLSNFDPIMTQPLMFYPNQLPILDGFINKLLTHIFPFNHLSNIYYTIARKSRNIAIDRSVSIIVPARNEAGNIEPLLQKLPPLGTMCEVIFVEGNSQDNTKQVIKKCIKKYKSKLPFQVKLLDQGLGRGKADAVRKGFAVAKNEILMIYDADMSISASDLPKFYYALISHKGELINGSRLVYPMEDNAMQFLNIMGNKFFSLLYSWILGTAIKDTLCGTKVLWRSDYEVIKRDAIFGKYDPFGDFDLLIGAAKHHLKIIDLPVRYRERTYGSTNIKRFANAWELFKYSLIAIKHLKMRMPI